ncbi:Zinc metalloproteinase precursor [Candidatus Sumerlaea chitinivorans]|uniref:Zinc metalloproteinase n=1 Tax=Sumerlaea chitinivorans TaxID=2250252 RepID=A0A2Z4Y7X2_SUMC1|nr:Zinc metalloproteinase precursor [Candidatus Sumerlaea chitinivorans]
MKKGLLAGLLLTSVTFVGANAFAAAPVISNIPDVIIGDAEDNVGTDNNFFVFTNAFNFDNFVSDLDTPKASLQWSFDEGDDAVAPNQRWFTINGKQAVHLGSSEIATSGNTGHNPPAPANELRSVSQFASFRDIIFSPGSGPAQQFPAPTGPDKSDHAAGKVVTFYVSDGTNVASKSILVATRDNQYDALSGGSQFTQVYDEPFSVSPTAWTTDTTVGTGSLNDYDSANGAIRSRVNTAATGYYRIASWYTSGAPIVSYGAVGSNNWVRGKFYVYRTGQSPAQANVMPAIRMRLMQRFVIASTLEVWSHVPGQSDFESLGAQIAPSNNPAAPSVYRVDFDPPEVPQNVNNPSSEGILAYFAAYSSANDPAANGYVALTELVVGTYPAVLGTEVSSFTGSQITLSSAGELDRYSVVFTGSEQPGQVPAQDFATRPDYSQSASGVTIDSTNSAFSQSGSTKRIGIIEFYMELGSQAVQVASGKLYQARFHVTSTRNSNAQAQMRLFLRSGAYLYNVLYEVGGARALPGTEARALAAQHLPGVGNQNSDKQVPGENGCWYTVLMSSPVNPEIQSNQSLWTSPSTPIARRNIKIGFGGVDTLSYGTDQNDEALLYTVDTVKLFESSEPE